MSFYSFQHREKDEYEIQWNGMADIIVRVANPTTMVVDGKKTAAITKRSTAISTIYVFQEHGLRDWIAKRNSGVEYYVETEMVDTLEKIVEHYQNCYISQLITE